MILENASQSAYRSVYFAMVLAYWEIGKPIVEHEQLGKEWAGYGNAFIKRIVKKLGADFGRGFALASLKNYRQFYLTFSNRPKGSALGSFSNETFPDNKSSAAGSQNSEAIVSEKSHALRGELSWTHYRLLVMLTSNLQKLKEKIWPRISSINDGQMCFFLCI